MRPEAVEAVRLCKQAGIRPVMIIGDHPLTVVAIAGQLNLTDTDTFLTGQDLEKMTEEELNLRIPEISVFARVSPSHKMIIIDVLQKQHESLFSYSWFSNPMLLAAVGVTLILQLVIIYVPFFNLVFRTFPLRWESLPFVPPELWQSYS